MTGYTRSLPQKERRKKARLKIRETMDAKVTVWAQEGLLSAQNETPTESWQGSLCNICDRGVQVVLTASCRGKLRKNQRVKLQFDYCSARAEATGQLVYIVPDKKAATVKLGIEFLEWELDDDAKWAINRICEDGIPCDASKGEGRSE
jgi:hypothetical protein